LFLVKRRRIDSASAGTASGTEKAEDNAISSDRSVPPVAPCKPGSISVKMAVVTRLVREPLKEKINNYVDMRNTDNIVIMS
jgi:hypothetical protein